MQTKSVILFFILIILLSSCQLNDSNSKKTSLIFNNPLEVEFGDPYILNASDGMYYMIGTGGVTDGFKMYSSSDLIEWKDEGRILKLLGELTTFGHLSCTKLMVNSI